MAKQCIFLLGGARSGKSHYAQELAGKLGNKVLFVATAEPLDDEMQTRIDKHKRSRPKSWRTIEAPVDIGRHIERQINNAEVIIIDCLTLLSSNILADSSGYLEAEEYVLNEITQLIACMDRLDASFIIISNEVGMGLVPENKLGRIYRDILGKINQLVARYATEVYFMAAGIPIKIK